MSILEVKVVGITKTNDDDLVCLKVEKTSETGIWYDKPSGISMFFLPLEYVFYMQRKEFIKAFNRVYDENR